MRTGSRILMILIGILFAVVVTTLVRPGVLAQPIPSNDVAGAWHYRSFLNESKQVPDLNTILFGEGDLVLDESPTGILNGTGDFGGGDTVKLQGLVTHGNWITVRFQGIGTGASNKDWLYDYVGVLVPQWPNGNNQVQAICGSVVRSAPHSKGSGGMVSSGRVASFIAVKK